jgi:CHAT domain-containing protein/tetratricopeptide (TPR) repeat protein
MSIISGVTRAGSLFPWVVTGILGVTLPIGARGSQTHDPSTQQIPAPARQDVITLETETVVERPLARGEEHRYQLTLTSGECVTLIVEPRGIDVIAETRRPDGSMLARFQDEIRGRGHEQVDVVAEAAGTYTLSIRRAPGTIVPASYAIRVAGRRAATEADRSTQESRTLRAAAAQLEEAGTFDLAGPLFERALAIAEGARGPADLYVIELVRDLAGNALETRDNARAEALCRRALAVLETKVGTEDPRTAMVQSRLALAYERTGQHPKAEPLLRQALEVLERTLGPEHLWLAQTLLTLSTLRDAAGDLEKAEALDRRALAMVEKLQESDSLLYASLLNNLGDVYRQKGKNSDAEGLFLRALAIGERLRGPESYYVSTTLQNLGVVARERKDYKAAEAYYMRALSIRERMVGPGHLDVAQLLNNLANVYHATGDDARALETHFRALRIWEQSAGPYERGTLLSVGNIARLYASGGDIPNAIAFQRRADAILETQLALNVAVGSEREKQAFVSGVSERTDRTISLHLREAPGNPDAAALAALVLLQRKGRVLDAMTDTFAAVRQRVPDPGDRSLLDQLSATTTQLAGLALHAPDGTRPDERRRAIAELEARKEHLEQELSEHSAEWRARMQPVTLEGVQSAMPGEGVLLEFAVFRPFDPRAERNAEAYGPPHYAAYVIRKHGTPVGRDLGPAGAIDGLIDAFRQALRDPARADLRSRARAVDEQVLRPLRASFGDATRLLISPDGELNLMPFEALVDEDDCYLIERYATSYLTSGRDLLRMQVPRMSRTSPVIVADPLFGEPAGAHARQPAHLAAARMPRRSVTAGTDPSTIYFPPIGGTAEEGRAIKALFPEATLLTGRRATKAMLQRLDGPRMLHIASHGFFLEDAARETPPAAPPISGTRAMTASVAVENPLLRSGLAFAGANLGEGRRDDGILTALEASGLNLWGTKLVTLSACDTGVGEVRNGEGVYGLRRAFVLAGAETLVMTLWPVSDSMTREPMAAYYAGLRAGLGRGDALRQAKLAMLEQKDRQHPFYWAGFIQSGEWASLDGRR